MNLLPKIIAAIEAELDDTLGDGAHHAHAAVRRGVLSVLQIPDPLTVPQVIALSGSSKKRTRRALADGELRRTGRVHHRISLAELERWTGRTFCPADWLAVLED